MDALRTLERKTGLVFTLLKASVYSMVLQQQLEMGEAPVEEEQGEGEEMVLD
jgi:DASH complex subunit DAD3